MGGFIPGAGQSYDAGVNYGPSASEAAGFNPYGGGSAAAMNVSDGQADAMGLFDDPRDYTQYDPGDYVRSTVPAPIMGTKQGGMPGGGPGVGYIKTGAPAYSQSGFLAGEIPPDGSFSGPFQVTQAPALQAAPKFSSTGSRRRR